MLTGPQKSFVAMLITTISGFALVAMTQIPDSHTVQLWGSLAIGACTVLGNTFGVYYTTNKATAKPAPFEQSNLDAEAEAYRAQGVE